MKLDKRKYKRSARRLLEEYEAPDEKRSVSPVKRGSKAVLTKKEKSRSVSPNKKRAVRQSESPTKKGSKSSKKKKEDDGLKIDAEGAIVID
jgi:hypothetical protein